MLDLATMILHRRLDPLAPGRDRFAYLLVISILDAIDNSLLMTQKRHGYAGIPI